MSFKSFMASKGAVGGTARWAANGYFAYLDIEPIPNLSGLLKFLATARYGAEARGHEEILLEMIEKDEIRGLAHMVVLILINEAGFSENTQANQSIFRNVILDELNKAKVPSNYIHEVKF